MVEGYCMKCKSKRVMKNSENVVMKNGRPAMKGVCEKCSTKMFKIGTGATTKVVGVKSKKGGKSKKSKKGTVSKPKSKKKTVSKPKSKKRSVKKSKM